MRNLSSHSLCDDEFGLLKCACMIQCFTDIWMCARARVRSRTHSHAIHINFFIVVRFCCFGRRRCCCHITLKHVNVAISICNDTMNSTHTLTSHTNPQKKNEIHPSNQKKRTNTHIYKLSTSL